MPKHDEQFVQKERTIRVINQLSELKPLSKQLNDFCRDSLMDERILYHLHLVCDELVTNIISYGYPDELEHYIDIQFSLYPDKVSVCIEDDGIAFNPLEHISPDITLNTDGRSVGGLGIHFVRQVMDEVYYKRERNHNILTLYTYFNRTEDEK